MEIDQRSYTYIDGGTIVATNHSGRVWEAGVFDSIMVFGSDTLRSKKDAAFILMYDKNSNLKWVRQSLLNTCYLRSVAVDTNGNSYITGLFQDSVQFGHTILYNYRYPSAQNTFLVKYDANGNVLWARQSYGIGSSGESVASDGYSNVYVAGNYVTVGKPPDTVYFGTKWVTADGSNIFIVKYDNNGNVLWATSSINGDLETPFSIAYSEKGDEYVTGGIQYSKTIFGPDTLYAGPVNSDMFLAKCDSEGNFLWARQSENYGGNEAWSNSVATDKFDNAYITGVYGQRLSFGKDTITLPLNAYIFNMFYVKFNSQGVNLWLKQPIPNDNNAWAGASISTDNYNHFYLLGMTFPYPNYIGKISFGNLNLIAPNNTRGGAAVLVEFDSSGTPLCGSIINDNYNFSYIDAQLANYSAEASDSSGEYIYVSSPFAEESILVGDSLHPLDTLNQPFVARWQGCTTPGFTATASGSPNSCRYCTAIATATPHGGNAPFSYYWSNGDTTQNISALCAGSYTIIVTDSSGYKASYNVNIGEYPYSLMLRPDSAVNLCPGDSITLLASGLTSYTWHPLNAGLNCTNCPNPMAAPKRTMVYHITGADSTGSGCIDTGIIKVNVYPFKPSLSGKPSICSGSSDTLTASGGGTYYWSTGNRTKYIIITPVYDTTITVTISLYGCLATDTAKITVFPTPVLKVTNDTTICKGVELTLNASGATHYLWQPDSLLNHDTGSAITTSTLANISYTVTGSDTLGCTASARVNISVDAFTSSAYPADTVIYRGNSVNLYASGGCRYAWQPSSGVNCDTCPSITVTPSANTSYTVTIMDTLGCAAVYMLTVDIQMLCGDIFVPDAFSPAQSDNNILYARSNCIASGEFHIFNRWGNEVYSSTDLSKGWDGTYKGQPMNTGTYVWYLKVNMLDGTVIEKKGSVALLR